MHTDLSTTDVEFLRVIRDINLNPEQYEGTDGGEKPANTTSIRKASSLSRSQINYRLGKSRNRFFGGDGLGLVTIHPAKVNEETGGFGPKSVELSEKGIEALSNYTGVESQDRGGSQQGGEIDTTGESEVIKQLHAKIQSLETQSHNGGRNVDGGEWGSRVQENSEAIQRVESKLDELLREIRAVRESEWGGIQDEKAENLERILNRAPAMMYAFTVLLEIDIDEIVDVGGYSPGEADEVRQNLYTILESASSTEPGMEDTNSGTESESVVEGSTGGGVDQEMGPEMDQENTDSGSGSGSGSTPLDEREPPSFGQ